MGNTYSVGLFGLEVSSNKVLFIDINVVVVKVQYLPHHERSHYKGVENSEEAINRGRVEARSNQTKRGIGTNEPNQT